MHLHCCVNTELTELTAELTARRLRVSFEFCHLNSNRPGDYFCQPYRVLGQKAFGGADALVSEQSCNIDQIVALPV